MLVSRRRELVIDQTRRLNRLRETLVGFFPGLELVMDVTNRSDLRLLARFVAPDELREAGYDGLVEYMLAAGVRRGYAEPLAVKAITAAHAQHTIVPGQTLYALLRIRQPYQADYRHTTATVA